VKAMLAPAPGRVRALPVPFKVREVSVGVAEKEGASPVPVNTVPAVPGLIVVMAPVP